MGRIIPSMKSCLTALAVMLGGLPEGDSTQSGSGGSNFIIPFGFKPLSHRLASGERDQARKSNPTSRFPFDGVTGHSKHLELLTDRSPLVP